MKKWCQRRTLPTGRHIGETKLPDHIAMQGCCQLLSATNLQSEALIRPMADGLAMLADQCHLALAQKFPLRREIRLSHRELCL